MDLVSGLKALGLREKEAVVYLALVQLGRASAYAVAEESGLKKPTTYVVLEELIDQGYVYRLPNKGKQLFVARPPLEVFSNVRARFTDAETVLPQLLALANSSSKETKTLFFENLEGVKSAYDYRQSELQNKEIIAFYASTTDVSPALNAYLLSWNKKNAKLGITTRAIVPDHPSLTEYRSLDGDHLRTVKVIPYAEYSADISIDANEYFTRIVMFGSQRAIILDDPKVSNTLKQIFELIWSKL